jgi:hypothetical protein
MGIVITGSEYVIDGMCVLWWKIKVLISLSREVDKGSLGLRNLEPWDHCIVWNISASECNNPRTLKEPRHLRMAVHPLPIHEIPKTFLQFECPS